MPGSHASPDRSRFRRDLIRLIVIAVALALVGAVLFVTIRALVATDGESDSVAGTSTTSVTTSSIATVTTPATTAPTITLPPARDPGLIPVLVLNSTEVEGLAGRLSIRLSDLGYQTLQPDNHPTPIETSLIWYVEGFEREAAMLAEWIPDALIEAFPGDSPEAPLTVVIGDSYRE